MYKIHFTNFGYGPDDSFATISEAVDFAKSKGFDATIYKATNGEAVGAWSIIGGYRKLF